VGIPVVFCGAIILLFPLGMTFNLFTLTGLVIVLGMVVDDAVVVSENIITHQERGLSPIDAAVVGTQEMGKPVMAAAITTALAFGPIVAMGGVLTTAYGIGGYDQIVSPMSIAIGWGLLFSTIITLFVIPALFSVAHDATAFLNRVKMRLTRQELQ